MPAKTGNAKLRSSQDLNIEFKDFNSSYIAQIKNAGAIIARNPIREKLMCQKLVANKKAAKSASRLSLNSSFVIKYIPMTVRIPKMALGSRKAHGLLPKAATDKLWILMNNPSLPKFSG